MSVGFVQELPTCYSRGVWIPMRKLHVFHQQLAIHEQFLTMRAIDSVGAPDQGGVLLGERGEMPRLVKLFLCLVVYKVQLRASLPSSPSFYTFLTHSLTLGASPRLLPSTSLPLTSAPPFTSQVSCFHYR